MKCLDCGNEFISTRGGRVRCGTCEKIKWPGLNGTSADPLYWPTTDEQPWLKAYSCFNNILCGEEFCLKHGCKMVSGGTI
jgi:hypothetical protein